MFYLFLPEKPTFFAACVWQNTREKRYFIWINLNSSTSYILHFPVIYLFFLQKILIFKFFTSLVWLCLLFQKKLVRSIDRVIQTSLMVECLQEECNEWTGCILDYNVFWVNNCFTGWSLLIRWRFWGFLFAIERFLLCTIKNYTISPTF